MAYVIGPGVAQAIADAQDDARSDEEYHGKDAQGQAQYSLTQGRDAMYRWTPGDGVKRLPFGEAAPATRLLKAIDVSSNNGWDISLLLQRYTPDLVIVKAYQSIELGGKGWQYTVQHAKQAQAAGCEVAFYVWLYAGAEGDHQVADALKTIAQTGIRPKSLLLDCETYPEDGSDPNALTIELAVHQTERSGLQPWIYTGDWWWSHHTMQGSQEFSGLPLWVAQYDRKNDLSVFTPFGGWTACQGKQYADNPMDLSIISSELVL